MFHVILKCIRNYKLSSISHQTGFIDLVDIDVNSMFIVLHEAFISLYTCLSQAMTEEPAYPPTKKTSAFTDSILFKIPRPTYKPLSLNIAQVDEDLLIWVTHWTTGGFNSWLHTVIYLKHPQTRSSKPKHAAHHVCLRYRSQLMALAANDWQDAAALAFVRHLTTL